MVEVRRIGHVAITVADGDRTVGFSTGVVGLALTHRSRRRSRPRRAAAAGRGREP